MWSNSKTLAPSLSLSLALSRYPTSTGWFQLLGEDEGRVRFVSIPDSVVLTDKEIEGEDDGDDGAGLFEPMSMDVYVLIHMNVNMVIYIYIYIHIFVDMKVL